MALLFPDQTMTVYGNTALSLTPNSGESIMVRGIHCYAPSNTHATVKVSQTTVGYFRVGGALGNHLRFPIQNEINASIFNYLNKMGIWRPIPVAEGETLLITGVNQALAVQHVLYDRYDAADIKRDMPNGSQNNSLDYIGYGRPSAAPGAGVTKYATLMNPSEFFGFPFTEVVPNNRTFTLYGILFSDTATESSSGANDQISQAIQIYKNQKFLNDEDLFGFPYIGVSPGSDTTVYGTGQSQGGNFSNTDPRPPYLFGTPLIFNSGDQVNVYIDTDLVSGTANFTAAQVEIGLIMRVDVGSAGGV